MAKYDEFGREIPDSTPVEMPLHFKRPLSLREEMLRMIRTEMSRDAAEHGQESFDEANDFEVDDDEMPVSNHELLDDEEEFRSAERDMLDKAGKEMDNERTVNNDRVKEKKDGTDKGGKADSGSGDGKLREVDEKGGGERAATRGAKRLSGGGGSRSEGGDEGEQ